MEIDFGLLTRVWCVAELVEADKLHLHQAVKVHSASSRENCVDHLLHLDVREAQASFPADKDLVLSKIEDVPLPTPQSIHVCSSCEFAVPFYFPDFAEVNDNQTNTHVPTL